MEDNNKHQTQATIEITESGALKITGNFLLKDIKRGTEEAPEEVLLCRCGRSASKPFCDQSHKK
jgi:CDGSH iron-sulfur domain-containing protein 3